MKQNNRKRKTAPYLGCCLNFLAVSAEKKL